MPNRQVTLGFFGFGETTRFGYAVSSDPTASQMKRHWRHVKSASMHVCRSARQRVIFLVSSLVHGNAPAVVIRSYR